MFDMAEEVRYAAAGGYEAYKDYLCTELPCCGEWGEFGAWSACPSNCRDCDKIFTPAEKYRTRQCGCSHDPRCHVGHNKNDIDLTACGGQSEDRESDLCDDRSLGEIPECCPEPCCGDVKGYFMII